MLTSRATAACERPVCCRKSRTTVPRSHARIAVSTAGSVQNARSTRGTAPPLWQGPHCSPTLNRLSVARHTEQCRSTPRAIPVSPLGDQAHPQLSNVPRDYFAAPVDHPNTTTEDPLHHAEFAGRAPSGSSQFPERRPSTPGQSRSVAAPLAQLAHPSTLLAPRTCGQHVRSRRV